MLESKLQHQARLWLGSQPDLVVFRNNVGNIETEHGTRMQFGLLPGSCDLIGWTKPNGRFFALELKGPHGRLTEKQRLFIDLVRQGGGFAAVARSMEEVRDAYERAILGLNG